LICIFKKWDNIKVIFFWHLSDRNLKLVEREKKVKEWTSEFNILNRIMITMCWLKDYNLKLNYTYYNLNNKNYIFKYWNTWRSTGPHIHFASLYFNKKENIFKLDSEKEMINTFNLLSN